MEVSAKNVLRDSSSNEIAEIFMLGQSTGVVADGPLAKACSDVLDSLYKREYDPITGVAMETQQMDTAEFKKVWLKAKASQVLPDNVGMAYTLSENQVTRQTLIDVSDALTKMNDVAKSNSAIVIIKDNNGDGNIHSSIVLISALEEYASSKGVRVYRNMQDFIQKHAA